MKFWNELNHLNQWEEALAASREKPVLVFKHSTRCSISRMALDRLERSWQSGLEQSVAPYYLDLLNHRDISNEIAGSLSVEHQSPQLILVRDCRCIYSETHHAIRLDEALDALKS